MTTLDTELIPEILSLIDEFGKDLIYFIKATGTEYDPIADENTKPAVDTEVTRKSIPPNNYDRKLIDGTTIQDQDLETGVAASGLTFTPETGMKVTFDGSTYRIENVNPIYTGDLVALYLIQLRG